MEGDVHETAVAIRSDGWHAGDGVRVEHSVANHAESAGTLGDQHASVGKERDGPWMREPVGHDGDADLVLLGCIEHPRSGAERRHRYANRRLLLRVADR